MRTTKHLQPFLKEVVELLLLCYMGLLLLLLIPKQLQRKFSNVEVIRDSGSQLPTEKRGIEQETWRVWNWNSKQTQADRNRNERERGTMQAEEEPWDCPQGTLLARPPISSPLSLPWPSPPSSFTMSHSFHLFYI